MADIVSVYVYNTGVFCQLVKINATTLWLSGLFKFLQTFPTTFLSALVKKAITKIAAFFFPLLLFLSFPSTVALCSLLGLPRRIKRVQV